MTIWARAIGFFCCYQTLCLVIVTAALGLSVWMSEFLASPDVCERLFMSSRGFLFLVEVVVRRGEAVVFAGVDAALMLLLFRL